VQHAHDVVEVVEDDIRAALDQVNVTTHLEPSEDERSYADYAYDGSVPREEKRKR
jgi:divalent metal cation (Fe/Co/Zn/Cd) transporter